ncbi:MAG: proline--tRNA ligase [Cytophagales bacterium]|nr:proline--tRNA ligase [Cytophagales bacterium]
MSRLITSRSKDPNAWYSDLVKHAGLVSKSSVRGCMVINPYGFSIWERIQQILDLRLKETGHQNAYFPLMIPLSHFEKELSHVEGFAKECAVVTHHRLCERDKQIKIDPASELEEALVLRPTSETTIWNTYRDWIQSYRDLPLLINQWANVIRWEMRTRPFLRSTEFLWQEGHTAHATQEEAQTETLDLLDIYVDLVENTLAIPVVKGIKTESERFAGAVETYCLEALMHDGKALQLGTSHFLGQNFAKAFDVKFAKQDGRLEYVWGSSWGVSTRLMGALIMVHGDDKGLVLPPKLAPQQVVIVPIYYDEEQRKEVCTQAQRFQSAWEKQGLRVHLDDRDLHKPGWKFAEWELKGVPLRVAIGPADIKNQSIELFRRDRLEKISVSWEGVNVLGLLDEIQHNMFQTAKERQQKHTHITDDYDEFKEILSQKGGFLSAHWDGTTETEAQIQQETQATIRCIPLSQNPKEGKCIRTQKKSSQRVLFAKAY